MGYISAMLLVQNAAAGGVLTLSTEPRARPKNTVSSWTIVPFAAICCNLV